MTLDGEDAKLEVLARATRQRAGAAAGAAVRDGMGRTYAGASVTFADPSLDLDALHVAISLALASGASGFEAAVVVGVAGERGEAAWAEVAPDAPTHVVPA